METYNGYHGAQPKVFKLYDETYEPCVGDLTSNGLWFAPQCSACLRTNKYQHIGDKACKHPWVEQRLNRTGEYVLFDSNVYHRGYWNNLRNAVSVTAQLFCVPSTKQEVERGTRQSTKRIAKDDFISGAISKEDIADLTSVLIDNNGWEEMLGSKDYRPAPTQFQGTRIDSSTNRQINKSHFHNLPLIQQLVHIFEGKFKELSIEQVWLIRKCSTESGFQGWHQESGQGRASNQNYCGEPRFISRQP